MTQNASDKIDDVCTYSNNGTLGHCEAEFSEKGRVKITLVIHSEKEPKYPIILSPAEWDRLVTWVEWRRKERDLTSSKTHS